MGTRRSNFCVAHFSRLRLAQPFEAADEHVIAVAITRHRTARANLDQAESPCGECLSARLPAAGILSLDLGLGSKA